MTDVTNIKSQQKAGLFFLELQSGTEAIGAPIVNYRLTVDTVNERATGLAEVTQALAQPVVCSSHVSGPVIYETVMGPGSKIRLDLDGYPIFHFPAGAGIGPVILENFKSIVLLDPDWQTGEVRYQYRASDGSWIHIYSQKITLVSQDAARIAAE